jgi:hypothetical protein
MRRRELFKAAAVGALAIAAPRISRAERPNKLIFVPPTDLIVLDPVVNLAGRRAITLISSSIRSTGLIRIGRHSRRWSRDIKSKGTG